MFFEIASLIAMGLMIFAAAKGLNNRAPKPYRGFMTPDLSEALGEDTLGLVVGEITQPRQTRREPSVEDWGLPRGSIIRLGPDEVEIVEPIVVGPPSELTLTELNGWHRVQDERDRTVLRGFFKAEGRSFDGEIEVRRNHVGRIIYEEIHYYIHDPPDEVKYHPNWSCFAPDPRRGRGWYRVDLINGYEDIDTGIRTIQKVLMESLFRGGKKS